VVASQAEIVTVQLLIIVDLRLSCSHERYQVPSPYCGEITRLTHLSARYHRTEHVQQVDTDFGEQVVLFQLKVVWKYGEFIKFISKIALKPTLP
jgi:hypothetical protein